MLPFGKDDVAFLGNDIIYEIGQSRHLIDQVLSNVALHRGFEDVGA